MSVRSKAWSIFVLFMTPCGVSTGILSFGDGIVVGAVGGGCGFWGEFDKLALCVCVFCFVLFFVFIFFFPFSSLSLSSPLAPEVWSREPGCLLF